MPERGRRRSKGQNILGFVDSDDYIAPTMYRLLYDNLVDSGADLSLCGAYDCFANRMEVSQDGIKELIDSRTAIAMTLESRRLWVSSVLRLYPRWILGDRPFPVGRAYEDAFTAVEFCRERKKSLLIPVRSTITGIGRGASLQDRTMRRHATSLMLTSIIA